MSLFKPLKCKDSARNSFLQILLQLLSKLKVGCRFYANSKPVNLYCKFLISHSRKLVRKFDKHVITWSPNLIC